jgi:hypothetical protein
MEEVETVELSTLLPWAVVRKVDTRYGPRVLRTAPLTPEFRDCYLLNQRTLTAAGISLRSGLVEWWSSPDDVPLDDWRLTATLSNAEPLFDYQIPHSCTLKQALETQRVAFDGSDTGTGKTVCALIAACRERGLSPVIVCKKSGVAVWASWCERLGLRYLDIINYDRARLGQCEYIAQVRTSKTIKRAREMVADDYYLEFLQEHPNMSREEFIQLDNPQFIEWFEAKKKRVLDKPVPKDMEFAFRFPPGCRAAIIMDEVHKAANYGTVNSKILIAARKSGVPLLMASATAAETPLKMDALGFALGLHKGSDFRHWCAANGCTFDRKSRQWLFTGGAPALAKIQRNIFPLRGSRMRKAEIPGFPKVQITAEAVNIGPELPQLMRAYEGKDSHLQELIAKASETDIEAVRRIYLLQMSETLKLPFLVEETRDAVNEGFSVVIAVNFNKSRERLMEALGTDCAIFGTQSATARNNHIASFQADKEHVIVVNIKAGSDSISLNDVRGERSRIGLVCPTDSAIDLVQFFGRLNRANDVSMSQYRIICAAGTPEDRVCRNVQAKINNIALLNDGDLRAATQVTPTLIK